MFFPNKKYTKFEELKKKFFHYMRPLSDIKILIFAIAIIMIWRGVWNLVDTYFFPEHFLASNILSVLVWVLILFLSDSRLELLVSDSSESE